MPVQDEETVVPAPIGSATRLPQRVQAQIHAAERQSEQLIGWVQLAIVLFFSTLYTLAPRAEGSSGFNFVPLALGGYFLFTLIRLWLSYRVELPNWYLYLSIIADVALLVGIIFSFHIQYDQPPTFYLKTPTLMYVFIFIVLRALRFDPRFVLVSGVVAVIGWLGLVAYAVFAQMGAMRITRNYVEYLTDNTILIGAELDKTMVIITVTAVLGAVIFRARALLFAASRDHAAAADLSRFFDPEVAKSITGAETGLQAGQGHLRPAAILYVDLRSFTATASTLSPAMVMAVLAHYQNMAVAEIEATGGHVDKFLGDGILATFGAVAPSGSFAADALRAAQAVISRVENNQHLFRDAGWPGDLRLGSAVASGPVMVGTVGTAERLEFTVIGNAVNRAAKLEDANKRQSSKALTDAETLALARDQGFSGEILDERPAERVDGIKTTVDLIVLA
ncbi:adenylate/guanylate cyclase domain-containing protein [Roseibium limicola]|uniref:Adenylate/guanylate cyclase domain-containing protein n=1 Tax=Roseibium limicola TaxID=2816037 RepID=A0A939EMZ7_9HYPH|nr:adenylate/guanylate cyclase domain-containing protein [Roseibium limicola]MBO0345135.1 adenylate/guanylate cyclase domain-containing protein [Roseibium limicola]